MTRSSRTALVVAGVLVALLVAGVLSQFASDSPDGLERVADDHGISDSARENPTADGPLAGYEADGVGDSRVSGAVAGGVGVLVVLGVTGGVVLLVRRRSASPGPRDDERVS